MAGDRSARHVRLQADTATEPRWYRVNETFSEDFDLNADVIHTLVQNLQGGPVTPNTPVALTMKHFPGGGPQGLGLDPHYSFGKTQVYPAGKFGDHLKPFIAAIDAGVSAIMPYYGVPISVTYQGVTYDQNGMAFSKQIVTDLLRGKLGFKGYVLEEQFRLGLFENPYVNASAATAIIGKDEFRTKALEAQRKSIVLLQNQVQGAGPAATLPLPAPTAAAPIKLYTMGMNPSVVGSADYGSYTVTSGGYGTSTTPPTRPSAVGADYAVIRVEVSNPRAATSVYRSKDPATSANPAFIDPRTGKTWGAQDLCVTNPAVNPNCVDDNAANDPDAPGYPAADTLYPFGFGLTY